MRNSFPSASMGFYLWDSIENARGAFEILPFFDSISTFDPVDAKKYNWVYRPLFWRKIAMTNDLSGQKQFDWCFIGTAHSDRHKVIHRLRCSDGKQKKNFVFCFFQSPIILIIKKFFDWTLWFSPKGSLSTCPMQASDVALIVANSKAVLDIEHPRQRGLTMRTIETLFAEKKLITTNHSILKSDLYDVSRVHVINRDSPKISSTFLDSPFLPFDEKLKEYYSCEGWIRELLMLQDSSKNVPKRYFHEKSI